MVFSQSADSSCWQNKIHAFQSSELSSPCWRALDWGKSISRIGEDFKEKSFKFLGHHIDENLTWVHHMDHVNKKLVSANYALSRSKSLLPRRILKNIYRSLFESHLHFGSIVWCCAKQSYIKKVGNTTGKTCATYF